MVPVLQLDERVVYLPGICSRPKMESLRDTFKICGYDNYISMCVSCIGVGYEPGKRRKLVWIFKILKNIILPQCMSNLQLLKNVKHFAQTKKNKKHVMLILSQMLYLLPV